MSGFLWDFDMSADVLHLVFLLVWWWIVFSMWQQYTQHICRAGYVLLPVCLSVHPSVTSVDQSKNGWNLKLGYATFTTEWPSPSSFCGISLIQKFWRVPPEVGHQTRVGWGEQAIF